MKNLSLLMILVAILGLPGCCCRKKEAAEPAPRNNVERYMETDADIEEMEDLDDLEGIEEEPEFNLNLTEDELEDLFKEDLEEAEAENEEAGADLTAAEAENELEGLDLDELDALLKEEENQEAVFHWIDEQSDDELRKLYFSFNHYGIRADQKDSLVYDIEQIKQMLADGGYLQPTIVIEGHADQEGDRAYNMGLSERRAASVANVFVAAGIDRKAIKVVGRGQECPMVINGRVVDGSREDRAPNRRVEIRVIYT